MQWIFVAVLLCVNTAWSTLIVNDPINIPQAFVLCETGCYVAGFCCHSTWMILFLCLHREKEKYKWTIMGCNDDDDDGNYTWGSLTKFKHIQLGSTHFFGIGFWRAFQLPPPSIANFFFQINLDFEQTAATSACLKVLWSRDLYQTCLGFTHTTIQCHLFCAYGHHQLSGSAHSFMYFTYCVNSSCMWVYIEKKSMWSNRRQTIQAVSF